ncbi:MAG: transcription antitermination factor NusB [Parachlamydia sp.]|jgi:N utilization substance protein B|nr:transcription antitermination factor NusB [Parachlamydia sp.]
MSLSPQKFREIVFQLLYSYDMGHTDETAMTDLMMAELEVSKKNLLLAQERTKKIIALLPEIDSQIASLSSSYDFERIQRVTRNILRLGVFELKYEGIIPPKVVIAEAIRLSRKFSTPESASFVNGLLDHLYRATDPGELKEKIEQLEKSEQEARNLSEEKEKEKASREEDEQP